MEDALVVEQQPNEAQHARFRNILSDAVEQR